MMALAFLASIHSSNCIAFSHSGDLVQRCDGKILRLSGIDAPAPENSRKCLSTTDRDERWCDTRLAEAAREALRNFLAGGVPTVWYAGCKDPEGAFLVTISVNGIDAGSHLLGLKLARRRNLAGAAWP